MYFTAETQGQILRRFHFALKDDGLLVLGKSERLITHSNLFTPVDLKRRLFHKVVRKGLRPRERVLAIDPTDGASQSVSENLRDAAFDIGANAQTVLEADGAIIMANENARRLFGLGVGDFGRPNTRSASRGSWQIINCVASRSACSAIRTCVPIRMGGERRAAPRNASPSNAR